jgi:D-glycero-D-manno-heptose 1,7-bisphosphate phosphatase
MSEMKKAAIFLDRDGTLNVEKGHLFRYEDWEWIPGAVEAIIQINRMDLMAIVITNQAGVARGYYDEEAIHELHNQVSNLLSQCGARIDAYYYCPHHPQYGAMVNCTCRKPAPGMLLQAGVDHNLDMSRSWIIGDKLSDVEAGFRAGATPILVRTGYGEMQQALGAPGVQIQPDILSAVQYIERSGQRRLHYSS